MSLMVVTLDSIPGYEITEVLGIVQGNCVFSKNMFKDMGAGFRSMVGGEVKAYTEMMTETRHISTDRMISQAEAIGADAILNVRYFSSEIMQGAAECMVVGTAVKLIKL